MNRLKKVLQGERCMPVPIWLMRQAGRYLPEYRALRGTALGFLDFCYRPELAVEATLQPIRRFDLDAAIIFSDILVVPHALGVEVDFREGEGPVVGIVEPGDDLRRFSVDGVAERLAPVYRAVTEVRRQLDAGKDLLGFAGSPWTLAVYLLEGRSGCGGTIAKAKAVAQASFVERLLDVLTEATIVHLECQIAAGADAVQLFDSWAGVLDAAGFERFVIEPTRRVVRALKSTHPAIPVIGFPRGAGTGYGRYAEAAGVDGLSLDSAVAPAWAAEHLGGVKALQGNLDNLLLRAGGPAMLQRADEILERWKGRPFVFNLGHGVLPDTPPENVAALVKHVHAWRP